MKKPRLQDYNENVLIILGNQTTDDETREKIRKILFNKFISMNYSLLFLLNKFISSSGIMKNVYADIIMVLICNKKIYLNLDFINEIIKYVSMDVLTKYGMESEYIEVSEICKNEFWARALEKEENENLIKKKYK